MSSPLALCVCLVFSSEWLFFLILFLALPHEQSAPDARVDLALGQSTSSSLVVPSGALATLGAAVGVMTRWLITILW